MGSHHYDAWRCWNSGRRLPSGILISMDWIVLAVALPAVVVSYVIFGIAGFGSSLVFAPILAQAMPVAKVVPLLALFDFIAAAASGVRMNKNVAAEELRWLVPLMVVGSVSARSQ
jgi:uncharacterized protein